MQDAAAVNPPAHQLDDAAVQRTLLAHICADTLRGVAASVAIFLPFFARRHFDASNTQTFILTVSMPVMQFFTIYWHRVFQTVSSRRYIALVGMTMSVPLLAMSLVSTLNPIIILWLISSFGGTGGGGAITPVIAAILRNRYPEHMRGRAFGLVSAFRFGGVMLGGFCIGVWSEYDPMSYRYYMPILGVLVGIAMLLYVYITPHRPRERSLASAFSQWWKPITESLGVLKSDGNFRDYEVSYMLYGVGWMICYALLPLIGNDKIGLTDADFSTATIVTFQAMMIVLLFPAGRIADRFGPVKVVSVAFLILTLYPTLLAFADSFATLTGVTILFALGMAGVHLGWTLGPVYFAPDSEQAPRYLAVHATLVGVRGILFQGLGVWLYAITGSASIPLAFAAVGFLLAATQMRRLGRKIKPKLAAKPA